MSEANGLVIEVREQWEFDDLCTALINAGKNSSIRARILYNRKEPFVLSKEIVSAVGSFELEGDGNSIPHITMKENGKFQFTKAKLLNLSNFEIDNIDTNMILFDITGADKNESAIYFTDVSFNTKGGAQCVVVKDSNVCRVDRCSFIHSDHVSRSIATKNIGQLDVIDSISENGENFLNATDDQNCHLGAGLYALTRTTITSARIPFVMNASASEFTPSVYITQSKILMSTDECPVISSNSHVYVSIYSSMLKAMSKMNYIVKANNASDVIIRMLNSTISILLVVPGTKSVDINGENTVYDVGDETLERYFVEAADGMVRFTNSKIVANKAFNIDHCTNFTLDKCTIKLLSDGEQIPESNITADRLQVLSNKIDVGYTNGLVLNSDLGVVIYNICKNLNTESPVNDPLQCNGVGFSFNGNMLDGGEYIHG